MANMVFYKLEDSPFFLRIGDFMFYFTSKFYMDKYNNTYRDYVKNETLKLNVKYNMLVDAEEMLLLSYYKIVEKRGFKVQYKGVEISKDYYIDCLLNASYSEVVKG